VAIRDSTLVGRGNTLVFGMNEVLKAPEQPSLEYELTRSVLHAGSSLALLFCAEAERKNPRKALDYVQKAIAWKEERPVYSCSGPYLTFFTKPGARESLVSAFADWHKFRGVYPTNALEGACRFEGGRLDERVKVAPQSLEPRDFRLLEGSAGKGAGPGGRDLGADVDAIGPGSAYERWKQTPAYQEWLKTTGQVK
jgi:hypothetical protein